MAYLFPPGVPARHALEAGCALHRRWFGRAPDRLRRGRLQTTTPRVLVELGELRAVVYRAARGAGGDSSRNYVHFFDQPPQLLADATGRRLFIAGGQFRVTRRGIEG